jgi:hypothetical protein
MFTTSLFPPPNVHSNIHHPYSHPEQFQVRLVESSLLPWEPTVIGRRPSPIQLPFLPPSSCFSLSFSANLTLVLAISWQRTSICYCWCLCWVDYSSRSWIRSCSWRMCSAREWQRGQEGTDFVMLILPFCGLTTRCVFCRLIDLNYWGLPE